MATSMKKVDRRLAQEIAWPTARVPQRGSPVREASYLLCRTLDEYEVQ
jgi:hypothetical protein